VNAVSWLTPTFRQYVARGVQPRLKSWGYQGLSPNTGALAGCWVREGSPLSLWGSRITPSRKIFENSDAKSCILVTTVLISGLPRTCISEQTTKFLAFCWSPNLKIGGTSLLSPYGCCAYALLPMCQLYNCV